MTEEEWPASAKPDLMFMAIQKIAKLTVIKRKLRFLFCGCCRHRAPSERVEEFERIVLACEHYSDGISSTLEFNRLWSPSEDDDLELEYRFQFLTQTPLLWFATTRAIKAATNHEMMKRTGGTEVLNENWHAVLAENQMRIASLIRDIFGNPFRPISFSPEWRTTTTVAIAQGMYDSRDFGPMPLLADALQDAGCDVPEIIDHCRGPGPHVRGCWVVDGVLGKA